MEHSLYNRQGSTTWEGYPFKAIYTLEEFPMSKERTKQITRRGYCKLTHLETLLPLFNRWKKHHNNDFLAEVRALPISRRYIP